MTQSVHSGHSDQTPDCDQIKNMAKQVQIGENLLTECFNQEDRGETPDWEQLRGLPGIQIISIQITFHRPHLNFSLFLSEMNAAQLITHSITPFSSFQLHPYRYTSRANVLGRSFYTHKRWQLNFFIKTR